MNYNSPEGFAYLLRTFFGYVWDFYQVEMPFFGISVGTFLIALAAATLLIRVAWYLVGGSGGDVSTAGSRGNRYHMYDDK